MLPPQNQPAELRSSQRSVCAATSNTPGLHFYGLYIYNSYFYISCGHSHLHAALCRPVDCHSVQHGSWFDHHSYDILFQLLEENIATFVKKELKKIQKVLTSDDPECFDSQREDDEMLDDEEEEQRRSSREAFLKITLHFLRRMKQEKLADCLQSSKMIF